MRSLLLGASLLAALVSVAAGAPAAQPIVDGLDTDGDPAVVALGDDLGIRCTGTLVSTHVIVTAAHCWNAGTWTARFGPIADEPEAERPVARWIVHPGFDPETLAYDVALVVLAEPAPSAIAPVLVASPRAWPAGTPLRLVGYGRQSPDDHAPPRKREGWALVGTLTPHTLSLARDPAQPCNGDSGGPALVDVGGIEQLVGITSWGDKDCEELAVDVRADTVAQDFIAAYVAIDEATDRGTGDGCVADDDCRAGFRCVPGGDARRWACARACTSMADCRGGATACEPDLLGPVCRYDVLPPGAVCEDAGQCGDALCLAGGDGISRCTAPCAWDDASCARSPVVEPVVEPGGCAAGGASGLAGLLLVVITAWPVLRPRRRRVHVLALALQSLRSCVRRAAISPG
jgi:hypothetical protein